ncbi:SDR family NAD(P)-dependent oxidoreductase [Desulfosporosinus sp.]|uniref:SDR family NAD(P)-dependent oxidoreductase n=1 Tax=Desulfosporosinus sp. TaxID=157907 RepID=UPI002317DB5C|nr:SDR family NAD(P)-dependent oxidoreductase [Desulfosporosinus sp.]MCO5388082.1 SDR family NAD(P)-dependent oxidoreductase [Desulfosporosinus sp.]MDA8221139.1 SDR family NAD(P)-dependent oxidoreductase [Desulfitobacterium hafniense]
MWEQKQVLVTGAGGFIGSHLTEALVKAGAKVRVFIRYNSRDGRGNLEDLEPKLLDQIEIIAGDLRDADVIERTVKGCDAVFHLGALVGIPYSYKNPREVVETNIMGTFNVLTAARDHGVERVVHTSTSEVYGSALYVPIDESHSLQGQSPYSASKIGADMLAESFYASFDLPVVTVRPFNCYGPRQSARAVIPTLITQALACKEIRLGNTETMRDFTFVTDTADGFMKAAQSKEGFGKVINIGSGREISIGELAQIIIKIVQSTAEIVVDEARVRPSRSEVNRLLADNRLAKETIGWEPRVSLEEGVKRTVAWIASHMNRFQIGKYQI